VTQDIERLSIDTIRRSPWTPVQQANSGHPGMPMAMAPAAYLLFQRIMEHNPRDPQWPDRDRFVLSAGHGSMLLYAVPAPLRLRPAARGAQALPPVGLAHAGHPSATAST
jgi:transketolase